MDDFNEVDELGLASRVRRLYDQLASDALKVYQYKKLRFKTSWIPIFHLLINNKTMTISELSEALNISHPAIIEITDELIDSGYLDSYQDLLDKRKRNIEISKKGKLFTKRLKPIWNAFKIATDELKVETGVDLIKKIKKIEKALNRKSLHERIIEKL